MLVSAVAKENDPFISPKRPVCPRRNLDHTQWTKVLVLFYTSSPLQLGRSEDRSLAKGNQRNTLCP